MSAKKLNYVSSKKLLSMSGTYNIVLGAWSNGKSYAIKAGVVEECYKNNKKFALIRRYEKEDTDAIAENYFLDAPVEAITGGKYNGIICFRHDIYLAKYNPDTAKWEKGQVIGRRFCLREAYQTKSGVYTDFDFGIFEEFVTLDPYLQNEFYRLQRLISTIARNGKMKVYLIGNTITPICPYYREMQLINLAKQKQGTIDTYYLHNEDDSTTKIQVYMTEPVNSKSGMFLGNVAKEANGGSFHCDEHTHFEHKIEECAIKHTVVFLYEGYKMLGQFIKDPDSNIYWYISPKTTDVQKGTRTVGQLKSISNKHTKQLTPLTPAEKVTFDYLLTGKIAYSDNLTGTLFLQMLKGISGAGFQYTA